MQADKRQYWFLSTALPPSLPTRVCFPCCWWRSAGSQANRRAGVGVRNERHYCSHVGQGSFDRCGLAPDLASLICYPLPTHPMNIPLLSRLFLSHS